MFSFRVVIALTACLGWCYCDNIDYCSLCDNHTMCIYTEVSPQCKEVGESGVSESEKIEIVDAHNWARRQIAEGKEERGNPGGQPKAADLHKIVWDEELAMVAQRWADQCDYGHDSCRNDPRWEVGQNIYWESQFPKKPVNWTTVVMSWYNEVEKFNPKDIEVFSFEMDTGHYTQLIWHNTSTVGCGRKDYGLESFCVCNYGPSGNYVGEKVYTVGEPCSSCPEGTTCEDSLCAAEPLSTRTEDFSDPNTNAHWRSNTIPQKDISSRTTFTIKFSGDNEAIPDGEVNIEGSPMEENEDLELDEETKAEISNIHDQLLASAVPILRIHDQITNLLKKTIKKCKEQQPAVEETTEQ